jgi:hypothetical protein
MSTASGAEIWVGVGYDVLAENLGWKKEVNEYKEVEWEVPEDFDMYDYTEDIGIGYPVSYDSQDNEDRVYGIEIKSVEWGATEFDPLEILRKSGAERLNVSERLGIDINKVEVFLVSTYF